MDFATSENTKKPNKKLYIAIALIVVIASVSVLYFYISTLSPKPSPKQPLFPGMKIVWFESGLLYKYSVQDYIDVLDDLKFDAVGIMPFPIDNQSYQLIEAVNSYCQSKNMVKFLLVGGAPTGGSGGVDWDLVNKYKNQGWVMGIDDSGIESKDNLQRLKDLGVKTMLVHGADPSIKTLYRDKLVDYSCYCFYPFYPNKTPYDSYKRDLNNLARWSKEYNVSFIPALQFFGKAVGDWRFPTLPEIKRMVNDTLKAEADGIIFFTPFSGQSHRGELFEGFLDHSYAKNFIQTLTIGS